MADKKGSVIKFDVKKINKNPEYQNMINNINKNPEDANKLYSDLVIMSETDNPIIQSEGGRAFIEDMKSKIKADSAYLENKFQPIEPDIDTKNYIDSNPEDAFKSIYNEYTYGEGNNNDKLNQRKLLSYSKQILNQKGINPDDILTKNNGFIQGLEFVANILNVPVNTVAKTIETIGGFGNKVKIWGGGGFEDLLKEATSNTEMKSLIEKKAKGIPYTNEEYKKVKDFDTKNAVFGTILNIVGDPTILAGVITKAIKPASVGAKLIAGSIEGRPFKALRELKNVAETDLADIGKNILSNASKSLQEGMEIKDIKKTLVSNKMKISKLNPEETMLKLNELTKNIKNKDTKKVLQMTNKLIMDKNINLNINNITKGIELASNKLKSLGKNEAAFELEKSLSQYKNIISQSEQVASNPIYKGLSETQRKLSTLIRNKLEKSGFRKLVSNVEMNAKPIVDKSRRAGLGLMQGVLKNQNNITKYVKNILEPELLKNEAIKIEIQKNPKILDTIKTDLLERPKYVVDKYNIDAKLADNINNVFGDYILNEVKHAGAKIVPLLNNELDRKEWKKLAKTYMELNANNPYSNNIPIIESKLKELIKTSQGHKLIDGSVGELTGDLAYLTHAQTDEAKKITQSLDAKIRNQFGKSFRSWLYNPSSKQRYFNKSITEINDSIKSGKLVDDISDTINELKVNLEEAKINKINVDKKGISNKLNELNTLKNILTKYKGIDYFTTDISKLVGLRGARMAQTVEQSIFFNGIKQFGKTATEGKKPIIDGIMYRKPKTEGIIPELSDKYFHPDIANAIERMFDYTKDEKSVNKLFNMLNAYQNVWRNTTLSVFPTTFLRNEIGNILNGFLYFENPKQMIDSFKDAINLMLDQDYKIRTKTGKLLDLKEVGNEAMMNGITGTTFKETDLKTIVPEGVKEDISKKAMKASNTFGDFMKKFPTSNINDKLEQLHKLATFISMVKEGKSFDDAAKGTYSLLFDYSDLSNIEKGIKSIIPFYTWTRNNLPLQLKNIMSTPSKVMLRTEYMANRNRDSSKTQDERQMSNWMKTTAKIPLGEDVNKGNPQFLLLEGLLPFFDLSQIARVLTSNDKIQSLVDETMRQVSPLIKTPIENITNRSFQFKTDIQKSPYQTKEFLGFDLNPKIINVLDDWRILSLANKGLNLNPSKSVVSKEKDLKKLILTYMLISPIEYDINLSKAISTRDFKNSFNDEYNNYKYYINNINNALQNGNKLTNRDKNTINQRTKNILMMIQQGYSEGKITNKERGYLTNNILDELINKPKKTKSIVRKPKTKSFLRPMRTNK